MDVRGTLQTQRVASNWVIFRVAVRASADTRVVIFVLPVLGIVAVFAMAALYERAAQRRRQALRAGGTVECRARLAEGDGSTRRGRLRLSGSEVWWYGADGRSVDLRGADVLAATADPQDSRARLDDVQLRLVLAGGGTARVLLHEVDAGLLTGRLRDADGPAQSQETALDTSRADGRTSDGWLAALIRSWPYACFALAAVWLGAWVWMVLAGSTVAATVIDGDGQGYCVVRWSDGAGREQTAEVDCAGEPVGATRTVWALAAPQAGDAVDPAWTAGVVSAVGLVPIGVGVTGLVRRRRRSAARGRHSDVPTGRVAVMTPAVVAGRTLPALTEADVRPSAEPAAAVLARFAPYAARQLPPDGWEDPRSPAGAIGSRVPMQLARAVLAPAIALLVVTGLTAPWPYRWYVLHTGPTATAAGTSTGEEVIDGPGPVPADIVVRFPDAAGVQQQAEVATTGSLPAGAPVTVRYAVDRPGRARLAGAGDGLDRGAGLAGLATLLALGWAGWRIVDLVVGERAIRRARGGARRPGLALLTADPMGEPLLLACDPALTPVKLLGVPLQTPLPHGTAASFTTAAGTAVTVHGRLTDGQAVVTALSGQQLIPAAPAFDLEPGLLLEILDSAQAVQRYTEED